MKRYETMKSIHALFGIVNKWKLFNGLVEIWIFFICYLGFKVVYYILGGIRDQNNDKLYINFGTTLMIKIVSLLGTQIHYKHCFK
jgi:hypothetical protein